MILLAGGTGNLGRRVVRLLAARGLPVRVLTRDPARAADLADAGGEVATGDVRDPAAVARAMVGAQTVISAIQGFSGTGGDSPETVDHAGNGVLMCAAREAGAGHFILVSVQDAALDHPLDLFRAKYRAEQALRASGLAWTILRPTASMETWAQLVGKPLIETGRTRLFGRGENPINFVAADDVARFVELAVVDPALRGQVVEVGGPENLTMRQVAQTFQAVTGQAGKVSHVPLPAMRAGGAAAAAERHHRAADPGGRRDGHPRHDLRLGRDGATLPGDRPHPPGHGGGARLWACRAGLIEDVFRPVGGPRLSQQPIDAEQQERDGHEALVDGEQPLPADKGAPIVPQPRECSLDYPPTRILLAPCDDRAAAFRSPRLGAALWRDAHPDAASAQQMAERRAVVRPVGHQTLRPLFGPTVRARHPHRVQGLRRQRDLRLLGASEVEAEGEPLTIDH